MSGLERIRSSAALSALERSQSPGHRLERGEAALRALGEALDACVARRVAGDAADHADLAAALDEVGHRVGRHPAGRDVVGADVGRDVQAGLLGRVGADRAVDVDHRRAVGDTRERLHEVGLADRVDDVAAEVLADQRLELGSLAGRVGEARRGLDLDLGAVVGGRRLDAVVHRRKERVVEALDHHADGLVAAASGRGAAALVTSSTRGCRQRQRDSNGERDRAASPAHCSLSSWCCLGRTSRHCRQTFV
jgi:hypothetical protein